MRIPLSDPAVGMAETLLDRVEGLARVHQHGSEGVSKIVEPQPGQPGLVPQSDPSMADMRVVLASLGVYEDVLMLTLCADLIEDT